MLLWQRSNRLNTVQSCGAKGLAAELQFWQGWNQIKFICCLRSRADLARVDPRELEFPATLDNCLCIADIIVEWFSDFCLELS